MNNSYQRLELAAWSTMLRSICSKQLFVTMLAATTVLCEKALASNAYNFEVIARTGQSIDGFSLNSIKQDTSVNNLGKVAFIGAGTPGTGLFWGDGGESQWLSPGETSSIREFNSVWIRDRSGVNKVATTFTISRFPTISKVRRYTGVDQYVTLVDAGAGGLDYDDLLNQVSINSNGDVAYIGLNGDPAGGNGTTFFLTTTLRQGSLSFPNRFPALRPAFGDTGNVLVRAGPLDNSPILLFPPTFATGSTESIASGGQGFTRMGQSPGIAENRTICAFAGDRGNGPGIFISVPNSTNPRLVFRVAGENAGPGGSTVELGTNALGQPLHFEGFDIDSRVAVASQFSGATGIEDDPVLVSFIGMPNGAATNVTVGDQNLSFSTNRGIWTIRGVIKRSAQDPNQFEFQRAAVLPVVQIGDEIKITSNQSSRIDEIAVYDQLASPPRPNGVTQPSLDKHYVAFWASSGNDQFVVRADTLNTFQHVVLVMMENRSFDHLLGWLTNADGKQAGLIYTNAFGQAFPTWHLAPYFQGCGCQPPGQEFGATTQYNNGACDGWLIANPNDTYTIGYYLQNDLPFLGQAATNWTVCDNYHAALMAETQPNRIYQHAAQTDSLTNRTSAQAKEAATGLSKYTVTLPTIWDSLASSNLKGHYYSEFPPTFDSILTLWGVTKYSKITSLIDQFYADCANGTLPAVSFVDPTFTSVLQALPASASFIAPGAGGDTGGDDDHPHSDIRNGEAFLASIYNAIVSSPNWSSTVLVINFDEWGGFFDHVPPPVVQVEAAERALGNDGRLGFRVPCLVISPWSRRGYVHHELFDHCSILKLIENRWGLAPLTVRDAAANDLADVLDFDHPDFTPPKPLWDPRLAFFYGGPCENLQVTRQGEGSLVVSWDAACRKLTVQTAPAATGPWNDLQVVQVSPYVLTLAEQLKSAQGYFRFVLK